MDILTLNRYSSWYSDSGHLELIQYQIYNEFEAFTKKYKKPILFTEYGAGAIAGLHSVCTLSIIVHILNQKYDFYLLKLLILY